MKLSYSRALFGLALVALVWLSLRPAPRALQALDLLLLPTRVLAELARPLRLITKGRVAAAEAELAEFGAVELAASRALDEAERRAALPREPGLVRTRVFVHALVLARAPGKLDRILIELDPGCGAAIGPGMPVVHGDVYVGRVACVNAEHDQAAVDLVTGAGFFVGGRLETDAQAGVPPVRMVVGGLAQLDRGDDTGLALAVHNPESARGLAGLVRVDEGDNRHEPFAAQAAGFRLGALQQLGEEQYEIEPELDYLHGLFRVVVVRPEAGAGDLAQGESRDVLRDGAWARGHVLGAFEPARWREGLKLDLGAWRGAYAGAAVVCNARLVGRVLHATPLSSDVALLGDPGCAVPVLAHVSDEDAPRVLGRLSSLGRDADGALLLAWRPVTPIADGDPGPEMLPAQLFTGSGELGVPRGLVIGDTYLPRGKGPHVLKVEQHVDTRDLEELWVRLAPSLPMDCP